MSDFDDVAFAAWEGAKTPLDKLYDTLTYEEWREMPVQTYYLYDSALKPVTCCICDQNGYWAKENDKVYVCEHMPIIGASFACRQLDSIRADQVGCMRPGVSVIK